MDTGESGRGGAGALLTQHCLGHVQEQLGAGVGTPLLVRLCAITSNTPNKMVKTVFTELFKEKSGRFLRLLGIIQLLYIFGRIFFEVLQAIFTTELDFTAFVSEHVRFSHFSKLFT